MTAAAWLMLGCPFLSAALLALVGRQLSERIVGRVAVASSAVAACFSVLVLVLCAQQPEPLVSTLHQWIDRPQLRSSFSIRVDGLASAMSVMVTCVACLIHVYSVPFMHGKTGVRRFFVSMNLFVGFMLTIVLAGDLLMLYLGWEGVGLCSYLLIGFWHHERTNVQAAQKAFLLTRIGDAALAVALFVLASHFVSLDIREVTASATTSWESGDSLAVLVTSLVLVGALAKSAQLPLHTWLPDAMAGPSPVSALIHAATMVTAGVYLIARLQPLFILAPVVLQVIAAIGTATLLYGALAAVGQRDIKRVLAYSTISQLGYMFLAVGVGAWSSAIFHLFTHASFKALLFLAAGVVILKSGGEHALDKLGGLRERLPTAYWAFLIGAASLAGVPWLTAGFFSKEEILLAAWASQSGGWLMGALALLGVFVTALYIFRAFFMAFWGRTGTPTDAASEPGLHWPLWILSVMALVGGGVNLPGTLPGGHALAHWLSPSLMDTVVFTREHSRVAVSVASAGAVLLGIVAAYLGWAPRPKARETDATVHRAYPAPLPVWVARPLLAGFWFDEVYGLLIVRPLRFVAHHCQKDWLDAWARALESVTNWAYEVSRRTQNGQLRRYTSVMAVGAAIALGVAVWL